MGSGGEVKKTPPSASVEKFGRHYKCRPAGNLGDNVEAKNLRQNINKSQELRLPLSFWRVGQGIAVKLSPKSSDFLSPIRLLADWDYGNC